MFIKKGNVELARYRLKTAKLGLLLTIFIFIFGAVIVWAIPNENYVVLYVSLVAIIIEVLIFLYYMHINDEQHIKELNEIRVKHKFPEQKPKSFLKYLIT